MFITVFFFFYFISLCLPLSPMPFSRFQPLFYFIRQRFQSSPPDAFGFHTSRRFISFCTPVCAGRRSHFDFLRRFGDIIRFVLPPLLEAFEFSFSPPPAFLSRVEAR